MQTLPEKNIGSTNGVLNRSARILGLTLIWTGILWLSLRPNLAQAFGTTTPDAPSVTLEWYGSPDTDEVTGYRVYYGTASRNYSTVLDAGNVTNVTISGLASGVTYFFAITAYNADGLESDFSDEITHTSALPGTQIQGVAGGRFMLTLPGGIGHIHTIEATEDFTTWTLIGTVTIGTNGAATFTDTNAASFPKRFYRTRDTQP